MGSGISSEIFKMYDIRGIYGKDLTEKTAESIGKAAGTYFKGSGVSKIIVGRDNRVSGVSLQQSLVKGILSTGCDAVDIGLVITPMTYFSWYRLDAGATIMVTASHNPAEYNGFKMTLNKKAVLGDQYQELLKIIQDNNFEKGEGRVTKADIWQEYKENILKGIKLEKSLKVVVDTGNGTTSLYAPQLFRELGCEVIELFTESDGNFPNHLPYPQKSEYYTDLAQKIKETGADCGLAFDGDGDRLGLYNEQGNFIQNDLSAVIFARDILSNNPGSTIVMNISTSMAVVEDVQAQGGKLFLWKTGYPFITEKMKELGARFGGEISGHFFFADRYFGYDDALYSGARFLEILSRSNKLASKLLDRAPDYFSTPEFRVELEDGLDKNVIMNNIKEDVKSQFSEAEILDFDGVRFTLPDKSWGLIRPSNTEPLLAGRAEAKTKERLAEIKSTISKILSSQKINLSW